MTRSKLKEVVEKGVVSVGCLFYCSLIDIHTNGILFEIFGWLFFREFRTGTSHL